MRPIINKTIKLAQAVTILTYLRLPALNFGQDIPQIKP
jgi:hypothetical protein